MLAGALLAATGCDAANEGTATPVSTTDSAAATEALWDPCTEVDSATLNQLGVDESTQDSTVSGVENVEGWKKCSWHDTPEWNYTLTVWSTAHSVDDAKKDTKNTDYSEVTVGGRAGVQFRKSYDRYDEKCYLAFPSGSGSVQVSIFNMTSSGEAGDPCTRAISAAEALMPSIPE